MDCTLEHNIREIDHAIRFPSCGTLSLTANFASTRIYDSRYCWGRLWRWFYNILDWITGNDWLQTKLNDALLHTHHLFQKEMTKAQHSLQRYIIYLEESGKGYTVEETPIFPIRHHITAWNTATTSFLKATQQDHLNESIRSLANSQLPNPCFTCPDSSLFQANQNIINVEGTLAGPLPLAIIKKTVRKKPLNSIEQKELAKWIKKINKSDLNVNALHKALESLHTIYSKSTNLSRSFLNLGELELLLENKNCTAFQKEDPKHIEWRQRLEPGSQLIFKDKRLTLGNELHAWGNQHIRAYTIEEYPKQIALIAQNRVALKLHNFRIQQQVDIGMSAIQLTEISSNGKVALIERLKELNAYKWPEQILPPPSEASQCLQSLLTLIQRCIQQNMTPLNLPQIHLMINEHGHLKTMTPIEIGPFDFNALEDFIIKYAAGSSFVQQELMYRSGLFTHQIAKFYRDLVRHTLQGEEISPDELAAIYKIADSKVIDRAALLLKQIKSARDLHLTELCAQQPRYSHQQLEKQLNAALLKHYLESKTAGTFLCDHSYTANTAAVRGLGL